MDPSKSVFLEIKTLSNLVRRGMYNSRNRKHIESLTGTNGWVIGFLVKNADQDVFQRDLEEAFSIRRSTASSILKRMEQGGLLTREPVAGDGRLKRLVLTAKAREAHKLFMQDMNTMEEKLNRGLSEQELAALLKMLGRLKANLE
jgi:DNA-binding MarR family transcriptional regulator